MSADIGINTYMIYFAIIVISFAWFWKRLRNQRYHFDKRIIIFSRYPEAGFTKTRLVPELGTDGAAVVQKLMTDHILHEVQAFVAVNQHTGVELQYDGGSEEKVTYWLERQKNNFPQFQWTPQSSGHLGERMRDAFKKAFEEGAKTVVLIGSDIPGINIDVLSESFKVIESKSCDMILGAANDGGYYLVGFHRGCDNNLSSVFEGIEWGTSKDEPEDLPEFESKVGISLEELKAPVLSAIVPTYNEEGSILSTLSNLITSSRFTSYMEVVVSDGGSSDGTRRRVEEFASSCTACKVTLVNSKKGRGVQLNTGAKHSTGSNLIFVHADTTLPRAFDSHVMVTLTEPGVVCGAFEFALDVLEKNQEAEDKEEETAGKGKTREEFSVLFKWQMKLLTWFTNRRAKNYELPYGDQGLFMTRRVFDKVGGFPEYRLMEDYAMVKNLQCLGHIKIVSGEKAITSARRWIKHGLLKVSVHALTHFMPGIFGCVVQNF
ncbi:hypothetical protein BSL78_10371 [Apostichopus japonicus]|uniref:Glycosyltransferase 2-like domain-containing protein n=1 Tax=Stichopus japonicus TaxID=307972 RepID=A0A2G8KXL8_STIJA|nr:hypothetical protein BSL78_10371 [Apostichopus japonicus]